MYNVKKKVRCKMPDDTRGSNVDKMIYGVKVSNPELKEEGSKNFIGGVDHALGSAILRRFIGT
jgi:hypothetical protein